MEQAEQIVDEIIRQGEILFSEGRLDEAEKYFLSLLPQYPSKANIRNNLGTIKFFQGDIITAKEYFLSALAIDEGNDDALSNFIELYRQCGSWQETKEKDTSKIIEHLEPLREYARKVPHLNKSKI